MEKSDFSCCGLTLLDGKRGIDPACQARLEAMALEAQFKVRRFAELLGMCPRQLQRRFRSALGRSPSAFLAEQRRAQALRRLLEGAQPKAVAIELGFKYLSHFCSAFKAWFGITPREFIASGLPSGKDEVPSKPTEDPQ